MLMKYLEFRFGTLCIKDMELLLSYQLYEQKSNQTSKMSL